MTASRKPKPGFAELMKADAVKPLKKTPKGARAFSGLSQDSPSHALRRKAAEKGLPSLDSTSDESQGYQFLEPATRGTCYAHGMETLSRRWQKALRSPDKVLPCLDLHHQRKDSAARLLTQSLLKWHEQGHRLVAVVHGKGEPPKGSLLKALCAKVLQESAQVVAFCSVKDANLESGWMKVLLKKPASTFEPK